MTKKTVFMTGLAGALIVALALAGTAWSAEHDGCDKGDWAYKRGKVERTIKYYTRCIESAGVEQDQLATALSRRGEVYARVGQYDLALVDYNKALELRPDDSEIIGRRGALRLDRGATDLALDDANQAIELDPELGAAYFVRATVHVLRGRLEQALAEFDKAIDAVPNWAGAYRERGMIHTRLDNYEAAIEDYRRALRYDENDYEAQAELGIAYALMGEAGRAIVHLGRAKRLNPYFLTTYIYLGEAYFIQGRFYSHAVARLNQASQMAPGHGFPIFLLGMVKLAQGRPADAVADFAFLAAQDMEDAGYLILLYIAQARSGDDGLGVLAENAARMDFDDWIEQVVSMYLGKVAPQAVVNMAQKLTKREDLVDKCRMLFYVGEYYLIHGDADKARPYFDSTMDLEVLDCPELTLAKEELARLR